MRPKSLQESPTQLAWVVGGSQVGHPIQIARANYAHRPVTGVWGRMTDSYITGGHMLSIREPSRPEEVVHTYAIYVYDVPLPPWANEIPTVVRMRRRFAGESIGTLGNGMHGYLENDPRLSQKHKLRKNPRGDDNIRALLQRVKQGDLSVLPLLQAAQRHAGLPIYRGPAAHEAAQERHARRKWRARLSRGMLQWLGEDGKLPAYTSDGDGIVYMYEDSDLACADCVNDPTMDPLPIARLDLEPGFGEDCCMCDGRVGGPDNFTSEESEADFTSEES